MRRRHIITLSGKPGSGKSSTADRVAEMLGYTRYSTGDIVRTMIKKKMTLAEFNEMAEKDTSYDYELDEELRNMRTQEDVVIDSRLGFYWIPESFKVYLDLDPEVAIARIYKDSNINALRGVTEDNTDGMDAVIDQVNDRLNNERRRFKKLYNVNPYASANFDLIIDTSRHSPQTVALTVFDMYHKWLKSTEWKQVISRVPLGYSFKNNY
jgi:cytidylate kinase